MAPKTNATDLAFDFGTHRIGVAVGNTLIRFAQPLVVIAQNRALLQADEEAMTERLRAAAEIESEGHKFVILQRR